MFKLLYSVLGPFPTIIPICVIACFGEWILNFSLVLNPNYCPVCLHVLSLIAFGYLICCMFTWLKILVKAVFSEKMWKVFKLPIFLLVFSSKNNDRYISIWLTKHIPSLSQYHRRVVLRVYISYNHLTFLFFLPFNSGEEKTQSLPIH